jgi:hypothetical protein
MTILSGKSIPIWVLVFLASCGPASFRDIRLEGEAQTRKLAEELSAINTKEELQRAVPRLKKRFNQIAEVLLKARSVEKEGIEPSFASEQLFAELARLYETAGCKEIIETAQSEAIVRLKR